MTTYTIFNGNNSQELTLPNLVDDNGNTVNSAVVTGNIIQNGVTLNSLSFSPISGVPGSYKAYIQGFDAPAGEALLQLSVTNSGVTLNAFGKINIEARPI